MALNKYLQTWRIIQIALILCNSIEIARFSCTIQCHENVFLV